MNQPARQAAQPFRSPFTIGWAGWRAIAVRTVRTMANIDMSVRCAGVAFFGFLSIFPGIAIAVFFVGLVASRQFLIDQLNRFAEFMPDIALAAIAEQLENLIEQPRAGLGLGLAASLVIVLWSGSRGMNALMHATSVAYLETRQPNVLRSVLLSMAATICGAVFLIVTLALVAALPAIANLSPIPGMAEHLTMLVRWPALLVFSAAGLTLLYRFTPSRKPARLRWIWPGALLASLLWLVTCFLFSFYVENAGGFEATFGSLAAAIVLLLWMYNSALIFVLGAAFNGQIELQTTVDTTIGPDQPMGKRGAYVADHAR